MSHKIIRLASHPQLLELLSVLLRLHPALADLEVKRYLEEAGVNVAEVVRLQSGGAVPGRLREQRN
jgi:hypothetical protein